MEDMQNLTLGLLASSRLLLLAISLSTSGCFRIETLEDGPSTPGHSAPHDDDKPDAPVSEPKAEPHNVDTSWADAGALVPWPPEVTFTLKNVGQDFLQLGHFCDDALWLQLLTEDGTPIAIDSHCRCLCPPAGSGPVSCDGCLDICNANARALAPGQTATYAWQGTRLEPDAEQGCDLKTAVALGTPLRAKVCWKVGDVEEEGCAETAFVYGSVAEVQLEARPNRQSPSASSLTLVNKTGAPIRVVTEHCGGPGWFDVSLEGEPTSARTFCPCSCNQQLELDLCPACGACADDVVRTLSPDESLTGSWDGSLWYTHPSTCEARYTLPREITATVRVCWTADGSSAETCQEVPFNRAWEQSLTITAQ
jgi:hypothetical protein